MNKFVRAAFAAAFGFAYVAAANAGIGVEANGARAAGRWGGELGLGYAFNLAGFSLKAVGGAFIYKGDNDRYYEDTFNNGQTRCRDSENGQFAKDSECSDVAAKPYGRVEATYHIPAFAAVGAGARFGSGHVRPYGTVAVPVAPRMSLKANGGPKYYAAGLTFGF